ncbi:MAG: NAD(P)-binding domain-containing protein, partial [Thermomicrobiaceae bacterium]|nr:NAD(P)-binding domain-containing protein [Thermomicrobiaceae bacterium]
MATETIGFIGVGALGLPMARRLLATGHEVVATSRRDEVCRMLEADGARIVPTPLIVADQSDIVFTCLPSDSALLQVYLGPEGVIEHLHPGATIVDLSTASPMMIQRIDAEANSRQIRVLDAPVSGGVFGAEHGTLTMMVGGLEEVLEETRPVLAVLAKEIY